MIPWAPVINTALLAILVICSIGFLFYRQRDITRIEAQNDRMVEQNTLIKAQNTDTLTMLKVLVAELRMRPCITVSPEDVPYRTDSGRVTTLRAEKATRHAG